MDKDQIFLLKFILLNKKIFKNIIIKNFNKKIIKYFFNVEPNINFKLKRNYRSIVEIHYIRIYTTNFHVAI